MVCAEIMRSICGSHEENHGNFVFTGVAKLYFHHYNLGNKENNSPILVMQLWSCTNFGWIARQEDGMILVVM